MRNLFSPVKFPVNRGTPMIQSMVQWDHSMEWNVADFSDMVTHRVDNNSVKRFNESESMSLSDFLHAKCREIPKWDNLSSKLK